MIPAHVHSNFGPKFHAILAQVSFEKTLTKESVPIYLMNLHLLLCNFASVGGFAKIQMGALLSHVNKVEPCEHGCLISFGEGSAKVRETMRKCTEFMHRWLPGYREEYLEIQDMLGAFSTFKLRYPKLMQEPVGLNLEIQYQRLVQLNDAVQTQNCEIEAMVRRMGEVAHLSEPSQPSPPRMPARVRRRMYQAAALEQGKSSLNDPAKGDAAWGKAYLAAQGINF